MGKTRDLFKKVKDTKGTLHAKMGLIKDRNEFLTMGRATPFDGARLFGKCLATVYDGKAVYVDASVS